MACKKEIAKWLTLSAFLFASSSLTSAQTKDEVTQTQQLLNSLGYGAGQVDGIWGSKTRSALNRFLNSQGRDFDGILDQRELELLLEENAAFANGIVPHDAYSLKTASRCDDILETESPQKILRNGEWAPQHSYAGVKGHCFVLGELSGKLSFKDKQLWRSPFNIWIRSKNSKNLEIISISHDIPFEGNAKTRQAGLSHLFWVSLDINKLFQSPKNIIERIPNWPVPFSYRRIQMQDIDADGYGELVVLGSREDGRGSIDQEYSNFFDRNFVIDFENHSIVPFGVPQFSHEMVISDLDGDPFPEILDMGYTKIDGASGTWVCDGETLECTWNRQANFGADNADLKREQTTKRNILVANCGHRYQKAAGDSLCWFEVDYDSGKRRLETKLISGHLAPYDASVKLLNFFGEVQSKPGWKVTGKDPRREFIIGKRGYHTSLIDLDADGDLDTINHIARMHCVKQDSFRKYYTYSDCREYAIINDFFMQIGGEFVRQKSEDFEAVNASYHRYETFDINNDGLFDIYNYGIGVRNWSMNDVSECYDPMRSTLINRGGGEFKTVSRNEVIGQYGCEIASQFFNYYGHPFRVFFAFKNYKDVDSDSEIYLAVEFLGESIDTLLEYEDDTICRNAIGMRFDAEGAAKIFSTQEKAQRWVRMAKAKGLTCGVAE